MYFDVFSFPFLWSLNLFCLGLGSRRSQQNLPEWSLPGSKTTDVGIKAGCPEDKTWVCWGFGQEIRKSQT